MLERITRRFRRRKCDICVIGRRRGRRRCGDSETGRGRGRQGRHNAPVDVVEHGENGETCARSVLSKGILSKRFIDVSLRARAA